MFARHLTLLIVSLIKGTCDVSDFRDDHSRQRPTTGRPEELDARYFFIDTLRLHIWPYPRYNRNALGLQRLANRRNEGQVDIMNNDQT